MFFIFIYILTFPILCMDFPSDSNGKESACNAGDPVSVPGLRRSPWRRECQPTFLPGES